VRPGRLLLGLCLAVAAGGAGAQTAVVSPRPDKVAVTVYRDPERPAGTPLDLTWLNGYALVTETRTVDIPAGESVVRFEGVAGGIQPESAIVTGLPDALLEKNRDAWLLSPGSLLDASVGRRVHIRRVDRATGKVTEAEARIRSGAGGAVVFETASGSEALRCTGLPETLLYDEVPAGLSAKPTLSIRMRSARGGRATLTLSYLAAGFDWQADYIAELSPDRTRIDLFAWLTLANGDATGFDRADAQAVAGRINREAWDRQPADAPPLNLQCWPQGTTTSDLVEFQPPPPEPPPSYDIAVTGSRVGRPNLESASPLTVVNAENVVVLEELGDLKLYRVPEPVTVAARSQKQIALLSRTAVPVELVYSWVVSGREEVHGLSPTFVTRNREKERLGLPLPAGRVDFYETLSGRRILVGSATIDNVAVGEPLRLETGVSSDVVSSVVRERAGPEWDEYRVTLTNSRAQPVPAEIALWTWGSRPVEAIGERLGERDGKPLWRVRVPANGSVSLRYRVKKGD
jgi:hypothetical protein